jgi:predicted small metal-binding protein
MSKVLYCGSVFPGCPHVIHADGEDELMAKAMAHARAEHEATVISDRLKARIRSAMREQQTAAAGA